MGVKLREENPFVLIWRTLVSSSNSNKEESDLEKEIEEIKKSEDAEHISNLLNIVKAPSVKRARFNDKNIKAKVSSKNIRRTKQVQEQQEEKTIEGR